MYQANQIWLGASIPMAHLVELLYRIDLENTASPIFTGIRVRLSHRRHWLVLRITPLPGEA